jgi:DNA polymerase-3 subunit beta
MKGPFTAPAGALVPAVKYAARWLDTKPANPVLGGLVFDVADGTLTIASQSELATARAVLDVEGDADGRFIVSGRLLDALVATLADKPITLEQTDSVVAMSAGRYRATLPAMPESDYPNLTGVLPAVGRVEGAALIDVVRRVGAVAGRDPDKGVLFTGIQFSFDEAGVDTGEFAYGITLAATDRLRVSRETVAWSPDAETAPIGESFVLPASVLLDAGDAFSGIEPVEIGWREGHRQPRHFGEVSGRPHAGPRRRLPRPR